MKHESSLNLCTSRPNSSIAVAIFRFIETTLLPLLFDSKSGEKEQDENKVYGRWPRLSLSLASTYGIAIPKHSRVRKGFPFIRTHFKLVGDLFL
jgi:hypothetical protein